MNKNLTELVFILGPQRLHGGAGGGYHRGVQRDDPAAAAGGGPGAGLHGALRPRQPGDPRPGGAGPGAAHDPDPVLRRGNTALLDALGDAIRHIRNVHKYAREEDRPGHTVFVITTDGQENASRRYGADQVRDMVRRQRERYGWEFLFLGANIDAIQTAGRYGITPRPGGKLLQRRPRRTAQLRRSRRGSMRHSWQPRPEEELESAHRKGCP